MDDNVQYVLDMKIIFQDELIIIADKPPGTETEDFVKQYKISIDRGGMVHRLDKDTSGLLVIAKKQDILENLQQQFREHQVKKIYTTLVYGKMATRVGSIETAIARDPKRKQAMKVIAFATGGGRGRLRSAKTEWEVVREYCDRNSKHQAPNSKQIPISKIQNSKCFENSDFNNLNIVSDFGFQISDCQSSLSLLKVSIATGRTHQIRVHMQYIGHPVLGDKMYNTKESRKISQLLGLNRQFLHATELGFRHPKTGEWVKFTSRLPDDLQETLNKLT